MICIRQEISKLQILIATLSFQQYNPICCKKSYFKRHKTFKKLTFSFRKVNTEIKMIYLKLKNEPNDYIPWKDPDDTPFI